MDTQTVQCPSCGEPVEVDIEPLEESPSMVVDCEECGEPMQLEILGSGENLEVVASRPQ